LKLNVDDNPPRPPARGSDLRLDPGPLGRRAGPREVGSGGVRPAGRSWAAEKAIALSGRRVPRLVGSRGGGPSPTCPGVGRRAEPGRKGGGGTAPLKGRPASSTEVRRGERRAFETGWGAAPGGKTQVAKFYMGGNPWGLGVSAAWILPEGRGSTGFKAWRPGRGQREAGLGAVARVPLKWKGVRWWRRG